MGNTTNAAVSKKGRGAELGLVSVVLARPRRPGFVLESEYRGANADLPTHWYFTVLSWIHPRE